MPLDPYSIREDFPLLKNRKVIYFDNAATSQKPRQVIEAIKNFYEQFNANIHRGLHRLSEEASEAYENAHEVVAKFIGAKSYEEIIFVRNTTEALNIVAYAIGLYDLNEGDEIIVTIMEHHSNLLPWYVIAKLRKAKLKIIGLTSDYKLNYEELENTISEKTRVIAVTHMSNVLGTINDVKRIAKLAHEVGAIIVVDGAQSVPHMPVNVSHLDIDFLAFSGHKMLGPTGIGVLYGRKDFLVDLKPILYGGDMIKAVNFNGKSINIKLNDLPWKFEAGSPNIVGAIGLSEAINYLNKIGMENVRAYEESFTRYMLRRIDEELKDYVNIYGPRDVNEKGGIISFNVMNYHPHVIATMLDKYNIAVRSGFHCAQPLHQYLGITQGSVRASLYIYNVREEIDYFIEVLKKIIKELKE